MINDCKKVKQAYIRLPRFSLELYHRLVMSLETNFIEVLSHKDYSDFLKILEDENPFLYSRLENKLTLSVKVSILNYLMRCTTRCTPYKGFSTIEKINLDNETNLFCDNQVSFSKIETLKEKDTCVVINPSISIIDDVIVVPREHGVLKLKSQAIVDYLKIKKIFNDKKLSSFEKKLLSKGVLTTVKNGTFYSHPNMKSRISTKVHLSKNKISDSLLEEIGDVLIELSFLNGNNINKSILWLEQIYEVLFNRYESCGQRLVDVVKGSSVFKLSPSYLLSLGQSKVCPIRQYFLKLISNSSSENISEITLDESHLKELRALSQRKVKTNLSRDFSVIVKLLDGKRERAAVSYFRSSFLGIRPLAEYLDTVDTLDLQKYEDDEIIYADILCSIDKSVLLKRPKTTKYIISVDGSQGSEDQTLIDMQDIYIYAGSQELVLYSKSLKKRIIPVLTTCYLAENDSNYLYRFLAALAKSHFNDGLHVDLLWTQREFLPRISYKGIVLFPKTWLVNREKLYLARNYLPEQVRLIDNERDQLLFTKSNYFFEQVKKSKSELLHFQEEFSNSRLIETSDGSYVNEIAYRYNSSNTVDNIHFKSYTNIKKVLNENVRQINIYAPEDYLEIIMLKIYDKYLQNNDFFYINYQFPDSHIRLRVINNDALLNQIFNDIQVDDEFSHYAISRVHSVTYEREIGTYLDERGVELYIKASELLSNQVLRYKSFFIQKSIGETVSSGPILETIYLSFLAYYLLKNISLSNSELSNKSSYGEFKKISSYIQSNLNDPCSNVSKIRALANETYLKLSPLVQAWNKHLKSNNYDRPAGFFEHRLLHMDVFRLTNGTFQQSNQFILRLAFFIDKAQRLRG